jgi:hypothetical protein
MQPEPRPDATSSFLSALADDLSAPPDASIARRHVAAAAAAAMSSRRVGSGRALRLAVAVLISTVGLGTGGVALAGGLPAPLQEMAADVARVLPLPISVPYPEPTVVSPGSDGPGEAQRRPQDAESAAALASAALEPVVDESSADHRSPMRSQPVDPSVEKSEARREASHLTRDHRDEGGDPDRGRDDDEYRDGEEREDTDEGWSRGDQRWEEQEDRGDRGGEGDEEEESHDERWSDDDLGDDDTRSDDEWREGHD